MEAEMEDAPIPDPEAEVSAHKVLSPAAERALAEAEARRQAIDAASAMAPREKGGRGGLEPVRYGDWEIKGLTSDF
ncbi:DUF1674 domain-containing protein [Devosia sp. CAU 1758]